MKEYFWDSNSNLIDNLVHITIFIIYLIIIWPWLTVYSIIKYKYNHLYFRSFFLRNNAIIKSNKKECGKNKLIITILPYYLIKRKNFLKKNEIIKNINKFYYIPGFGLNKYNITKIENRYILYLDKIENNSDGKYKIGYLKSIKKTILSGDYYLLTIIPGYFGKTDFYNRHELITKLEYDIEIIGYL